MRDRAPRLIGAEPFSGCGVRGYKCPSESLTLEHREQTIDPPQNPREYTRRYLAYREAGRQYKRD